MSSPEYVTPPAQDLDAEESIIGAMMLSAKAIDAVRTLVFADDFYNLGHGRLYAAVLNLADTGAPVDVITLRDYLEERGELETAGGEGKLMDIACSVPVAANAPHYAKIVHDLAIVRRIREAGLRIVQLGTDRPGTTVDLIAEAEQLVSSLGAASRKNDRRVRLFDALVWAEEKIKTPVGPEAAGVPTPWSFLGPMQPARLYVLGGYQADGKTAASAQFVRSAAEAKKRVGFVSIEMSWQDLTDRFMTSFGIPYHRCQSGEMGPYRETANEALATMAGWDVDIVDDSDVNVAALRAYQRLYAWDLMIIDHLHRLDWAERRELEQTVRGITNLARDFRIPVLLLAQLKRGNGTGKTAYPRPTMASLRESGMIEAEAAAVWMIWRHRDDDDLPTAETDFLIAKNRFGETGVKPLLFDRSAVTFKEPR